jgi:dTDP-4-dehydrorhamnose 3,5-epimerase
LIFTEITLPGAFVIDPERRADDRGFFARAYCANEFEQHGLNPRVVNTNLSRNARKGTLRGMHFQRPPYEEAKLVRCTRGAIYDVIIDLRPSSETFAQWIGVELTAESCRLLYVPEGFAHGFETLEDDTDVTYQVSEFYTPGSEGGLRYDDPTFGIDWPLPVSVISDKDATWPDFEIASVS